MLGGLKFDLETYEEEGDFGISRVRVHGQAGGAELSQTMWQAVQVRARKAVWWQTVRSEQEARAAIADRAADRV